MQKKHTLSHCFSSLESMLSITIFVCMGTQVRRSNPSQTLPLYWRFVYNEHQSMDQLMGMTTRRGIYLDPSYNERRLDAHAPLARMVCGSRIE
jgi:hypothetical protein